MLKACVTPTWPRTSSICWVAALTGNLIRPFDTLRTQQCWEALAHKENHVTAIADTENTRGNSFGHPEPRPGSWKAAFLAGLPHILMGLLIGIGKSLTTATTSSQTMSIIAGVSLMGLVVVVLFFAWRRGWPLWSASWYGYGTWAAMALISFVISQLELDEDWRYSNALFLGWIGLCIIGYFYILSKDRLKALLAVAFLFPMLGIMFLEFVPDFIEGWLAIGLGLLTTLTAGAIVRLGDFPIGLRLALGVNFVNGMALAYVGEYQASDLPPGIPHTPSFSNFAELLTLYLVLAFGLIGGPLLLWSLWNSAMNRVQPSE
jgi:hypothetical protein